MCDNPPVDPFGWSPDQYTAAGTWVAAFAAVATLVVVIWTARYAKGQLDEAQRLRLAQSRPYVVVSIGVEQQMMFMLVVENVGKVPAQNVRVQFDEPPQSTTRELDDLRLLKEPIPTMPPGHRYRAYWDSAPEVFGEDKPYPYPLSYRVAVTYEDQQGHDFGPEHHILDFRIYEGQAAYPKGIPELTKAVEKIQKQQAQWSQRGILVRAVDEVTRERRSYRPILIGRALKQKDDEGWLGLLRFVVGHHRRRYGVYEREGYRRRES